MVRVRECFWRGTPHIHTHENAHGTHTRHFDPDHDVLLEVYATYTPTHTRTRARTRSYKGYFGPDHDALLEEYATYASTPTHTHTHTRARV